MAATRSAVERPTHQAATAAAPPPVGGHGTDGPDGSPATSQDRSPKDTGASAPPTPSPASEPAASLAARAARCPAVTGWIANSSARSAADASSTASPVTGSNGSDTASRPQP